MKIAFCIVSSVIAAYVSNEGHRVSYAAIETAGTPDSLALFEYGQWVFIISGTISIMFLTVALIESIKRIGN